jgi:hypothetical protein
LIWAAEEKATEYVTNNLNPEIASNHLFLLAEKREATR